MLRTGKPGGEIALYPAVVVAGIMVINLFGGLLGYLETVNNVLFILGIFLAFAGIAYILLHRNRFSKNSIGKALPLFYFLIGGAVLTVLLDGRFLYDYDDFSFWGMAARILSEEQRLPMQGDLLIHTSYPPGCALLISFFANTMGNDIGVYLYAQAVMLLAFLISLFAASKKVWMHIITIPFIALLMQYNIKLETLSVDNVLAGATIAAIMMCFSSRGAYIHKAFLQLSIVLSALVLIKNSGLFLAMLILCFAIFLYFTHRKKLRLHLFWLLLPVVVLLLWKMYANQAFIATGKHDMSVDYYKSMLADKQLSGIKETIEIIVPRLFNPSYNHALYLVPGYIVLLPMLNNSKKYRSMFWFAALMFVVYEIGVLLMYVFSMPTSEVVAQNGADYYRYNGTIVAVLAGVLFYMVCAALQKRHISNMRQIVASVTCCLVFCLAMWSLNLMYTPTRTKEYRAARNSSIVYLQQVAEDAIKNNGNAFVLLLNEGDSETYYELAAQYYLRTDEVTCFTDEEAVRAELENQPWTTFINLQTQEMELAKETAGAELFTHTTAKEYSNILDQVGYRENMRYSRWSDDYVIAAGWDLTGQFLVRTGDIIRFNNVIWYPSEENNRYCSLYWFALDKAFLDKVEVTSEANLERWNPVYDEAGNIIQITVPELSDSMVYLQLACQDICSASVITVNEEIPE